jgi:DNA-binding transcriptional LysR family regulator
MLDGVWGGIEIREIETLLVLAEELHFGRTAERLGVSTARVSQTVRGMERRLNGQLFDRTSRRVSLTLAGQRVVERLRPVVAELERCLSETAGFNAGLHGTLRIGHILTAEGVPEVGRLVSEFERLAPTSRVLRLRFELADYVKSLQRGEVDVWLSWWPSPAPDADPAEGLRCGPPIASVGATLLVDRSHPLAGRSSITLDDLVEHPLVALPVHTSRLFRQRWLPERTPAGRPIPQVVEESWQAHFHELGSILEQGQLAWLTIATFLRTVSMPQSVVAVPVRDAPGYVLVPWWRADERSALVGAFIDLIGSLSDS